MDIAFESPEQAIAVALANLKGTHNKDLLRTAAALSYLTNSGRFRSADELAAAVGVSREIVREFKSLLRLPEAVQEMIRSGELRSLEQGRRLAQLAKHRPREVEAAARVIASLSAHDSRAVVDYMIGHRDATPAEAAEAVQRSEDVVTREFHVVAVLTESEYESLRSRAEGYGLAPDELVTQAVRELIGSQE